MSQRKKNVTRATSAAGGRARNHPPSSTTEEFLALSDAEKERVYRALDREYTLEETRPLNAAERQLWREVKERTGRPKVGKGAKVVSVSIERGLLDRSDRYARRKGMTRAQLIAEGLRLALKAAG